MDSDISDSSENEEREDYAYNQSHQFSARDTEKVTKCISNILELIVKGYRKDVKLKKEHKKITKKETKEVKLNKVVDINMIIENICNVIKAFTSIHTVATASRHCEAVSGTSRQSEAVPGTSRQSEALPGTSRQSEAVPGTSRQSEALPGTSRQSEAVPVTSRQSEAVPETSRQSVAAPGTSRQSVQAPATSRHCEAVPTVPTAPRHSEAVPTAPRHKEAVSGTSRHSEAISTTSRHREAVPTTPRQSEAVCGTSGHSVAVPGIPRQSEAVPGTSRQSEAIRGNSSQSGIFSGCFRQSGTTHVTSRHSEVVPTVSTAPRLPVSEISKHSEAVSGTSGPSEAVSTSSRHREAAAPGKSKQSEAVCGTSELVTKTSRLGDAAPATSREGEVVPTIRRSEAPLPPRFSETVPGNSKHNIAVNSRQSGTFPGSFRHSVPSPATSRRSEAVPTVPTTPRHSETVSGTSRHSEKAPGTPRKREVVPTIRRSEAPRVSELVSGNSIQNVAACHSEAIAETSKYSEAGISRHSQEKPGTSRQSEVVLITPSKIKTCELLKYSMGKVVPVTANNSNNHTKTPSTTEDSGSSTSHFNSSNHIQISNNPSKIILPFPKSQAKFPPQKPEIPVKASSNSGAVESVGSEIQVSEAHVNCSDFAVSKSSKNTKTEVSGTSSNSTKSNVDSSKRFTISAPLSGCNEIVVTKTVDSFTKTVKQSSKEHHENNVICIKTPLGVPATLEITDRVPSQSPSITKNSEPARRNTETKVSEITTCPSDFVRNSRNTKPVPDTSSSSTSVLTGMCKSAFNMARVATLCGTSGNDNTAVAHGNLKKHNDNTSLRDSNHLHSTEPKVITSKSDEINNKSTTDSKTKVKFKRNHPTPNNGEPKRANIVQKCIVCGKLGNKQDLCKHYKEEHRIHCDITVFNNHNEITIQDLTKRLQSAKDNFKSENKKRTAARSLSAPKEGTEQTVVNFAFRKVDSEELKEPVIKKKRSNAVLNEKVEQTNTTLQLKLETVSDDCVIDLTDDINLGESISPTNGNDKIRSVKTIEDDQIMNDHQIIDISDDTSLYEIPDEREQKYAEDLLLENVKQEQAAHHEVKEVSFSPILSHSNIKQSSNKNSSKTTGNTGDEIKLKLNDCRTNVPETSKRGIEVAASSLSNSTNDTAVDISTARTATKHINVASPRTSEDSTKNIFSESITQTHEKIEQHKALKWRNDKPNRKSPYEKPNPSNPTLLITNKTPSEPIASKTSVNVSATSTQQTQKSNQPILVANTSATKTNMTQLTAHVSTEIISATVKTTDLSKQQSNNIKPNSIQIHNLDTNNTNGSNTSHTSLPTISVSLPRSTTITPIRVTQANQTSGVNCTNAKNSSNAMSLRSTENTIISALDSMILDKTLSPGLIPNIASVTQNTPSHTSSATPASPNNPANVSIGKKSSPTSSQSAKQRSNSTAQINKPVFGSTIASRRHSTNRNTSTVDTQAPQTEWYPPYPLDSVDLNTLRSNVSSRHKNRRASDNFHGTPQIPRWHIPVEPENETETSSVTLNNLSLSFSNPIENSQSNSQTNQRIGATQSNSGVVEENLLNPTHQSTVTQNEGLRLPQAERTWHIPVKRPTDN